MQNPAVILKWDLKRDVANCQANKLDKIQFRAGIGETETLR